MRHTLIVGAGPAGAALAYLLARRNLPVTLLERQTDFEREFRGEGLMPSGIDAFRQMGLAAELDAVPHTRLVSGELYRDRRILFRFSFTPDQQQRFPVRFISQPALLEMLVAQASRFPAFRFERGALVQDLIRENGRVAGVRLYSPDHQPRDLRADFIIGADGRGSTVRRLSGIHQERLPQAFDVVWCKIPLPDSFENGSLARVYLGHGHFAFMFPAADGRLQLAWIIHKGAFGELSRQGMDQWMDEVAGHLDPDLAAHFHRHRQDATHPFLLNVVCDHLDQWTTPGLLLIGDASHPMSPVGAQGINIALRDALVAANHLIPTLLDDSSPDQLDAAAHRIQQERLPEVITIQQFQQGPPRILFQTAWWSGIALTMLPWLLRAGLAQALLGPTFLRLTQGVTTITLNPTEPRP